MARSSSIASSKCARRWPLGYNLRYSAPCGIDGPQPIAFNIARVDYVIFPEAAHPGRNRAPREVLD
eukprot:7062574-Pyramimonas_sp.AAC.1